MRWTPATGFASSDAHVAPARPCSGFAAPATAGSGTAARLAKRRRGPSRSGEREPVIARRPSGRLDHRDREQERRAREVERARVADHSPSFLAPVASVCPPDDPPSPIPGEVVVIGEGHDDETWTDGNSDDDPGGDPRLGADGRRRGAQGGLAAVLLGAASTLPADAARGDGALAPGAGARCRFCARRGLVVSAWPRRGVGRRLSTAHYTVEMRAPVRERGQRIRGLGSFADAQQLDLAGVR